MHALRVNETKVKSRNAFIVNLFALGKNQKIKKKRERVRKNKKMMEGPSFETAHRVLTCLVALRPHATFMQFSGLF